MTDRAVAADPHDEVCEPSVCIARTSTTWPRLRTAPTIGLSVLAEEHGYVARSLAARRIDRFAGVDWTQTREGAVFVQDSALWLDCTRHDDLPAGDHEIVLLHIRQLWTYPEVSVGFARPRAVARGHGRARSAAARRRRRRRG
jgi:flavin reductase (DIM6/NTAB) family NADH-FMN oxidoreductase RutF